MFVRDSVAPRRRAAARAGLAAALALACVAGLAPSGRAAEPLIPGDADVEVRLDDALVRVSQTDALEPELDHKPIVVDLEVRGGKWQEKVWGFAISFNQGEHEGRLLEAQEAAGRARLKVRMTIEPDLWVTGGPAEWLIDLAREGDRLEGSFEGTYRGRAVKGRAAGRIRGPCPVPVPGRAPAKAMQHPRLVGWQPPPSEQGGAARVSLAEALDRLRRAEGGRVLDVADQVVERAYMYDQNCMHWEERGRREVADWLAEASAGLIRGGGSGWNPTPWSNWQGRGRAAAGIAALAILGDPGDYPPRPPDLPVTEIAAPKDFAPGRGVPVAEAGEHPLVNAMSVWWLACGPFSPAGEEDHLAALGGCAAARPAAGTKVTFQDAASEFRAVPRDLIRQGLRPAVDILQLTGGKGNCVMYFYTVVRVLFPQAVRVAVPSGDPLWIAGTPVKTQDIVRLEPGLYPVLCRVPLGVVPPFGGLIWPAPLLETCEDPREQVARWEAGREAWEAAGRPHPGAERSLTIAARCVRRYLNTCYGDAGWNTEGSGYAQYALSLVVPFLESYRSVTARDLARNSNIERLAVIYRAAAVERKQGGPYVPYLGVGAATATTSPHLYEIGLKFAPEDLKPALLWRPGSDGPNPGDVLGHVIVDRQKGGYVFRKSWRDEDDVEFLLYARSQPLRACWGHADGGAFRIVGFGAEWATRGPVQKVMSREAENVILVGDAPMALTKGAACRVTHFEPRKDGSGAVTLNMDDLYLGVPAEKTEWLGWYGELVREGLKDLGIRHTRAVAVDYSEACGAPALFVLADRMTGPCTKTWQMGLPKGKWDKPVGEVKVDGNRFTVTVGEASLAGTFVAPAGVELVHGGTYEQADRRDREKTLEFNLHAIRASAAAGRAGDFLCVMTLQKGPAPEVTVEGSGLGAVVKVGRRTVRFDGERIVLGE